MRFNWDFSWGCCNSSCLLRRACSSAGPLSTQANFYLAPGRLYIICVLLDVLRKSAVALHDVLRQAVVFFIIVDQLFQHAVEDCRHCKKSLNRRTDIAQPFFVAKDLLDYECCDRFWQCLPILHDSQAEWDDLGLHQKCNGIRITFFYKSSNYP